MGRPPSLTPAQQKEATRRGAQGATLQELTDSYDCSISTIAPRHPRLMTPTTVHLGRSFYFRQTHTIDTMEKISAGCSRLLATAWSDRQ